MNLRQRQQLKRGIRLFWIKTFSIFIALPEANTAAGERSEEREEGGGAWELQGGGRAGGSGVGDRGQGPGPVRSRGPMSGGRGGGQQSRGKNRDAKFVERGEGIFFCEKRGP